MNIFIIGPSRSAKTPIAQKVATTLGGTYISASDWIRKQYVSNFPIVTIADRQKAMEELTNLSQKLLAEDPNHCINHISNNYPGVLNNSGLFILEGIRNPRDFSRLICPNTDLVCFLNIVSSPLSPMFFETEGCSIIEQTTNWFAKCGLMPSNHIMKVRISDFSEIDMITQMISKWVMMC